VVEDANAAEHRKPVMFHERGITDRNERQLLGASVRHVGSGWQKLLEKTEKTKCRSGDLPLKAKENA
jgi:hypothetical protein